MKIVRKLDAAGPCHKLGKLERVTPRFFVFDPFKPEDGQTRIARENGHVEPCRRCKDYRPPQNTFLERAREIAALRQQRIAEERQRLGLGRR
jgi:hypothetical protein